MAKTDKASRAFSIFVRVYYEDTDAAGVVYYARYLGFMERARTEWLHQYDISIDELARDQQVLFAVRAVKIDYRRPARLNDLVQVTAEVASVRGASMTMRQTCLRGDDLLCEADVDLACLDAQSFAPRKWPPELVRAATLISMPARRNP